MATKRKIQHLNRLVGPIVDAMTAADVEALLSLRSRRTLYRTAVGRGRTLSTGDLLLLAIRARVMLRMGPRKVGPLPDDFEPNEETRQAIRDVNAGIGVTRYDSAAEMFADMGL
jgi:hypothetical protein